MGGLPMRGTLVQSSLEEVTWMGSKVACSVKSCGFWSCFDKSLVGVSKSFSLLRT